MTIKETNRMTQLLMAQAGGKQLQAPTADGKRYEDIQVLPALYSRSLTGIGVAYDIKSIRIKPEIKYMPYDIKDLTYFMIQGTKFVHNESNLEFIITGVHIKSLAHLETVIEGKNSIALYANEFLEKLTLDGHPAGNPVEVENETT